MANSLMELYGGGMTGEPTNYQIGGAVSRAKISSKYLSDYKKVQDAHKENIKNMRFWSNVGDWGSFFANLVVPGSGGFIKAGAESLYRPEDVGDIDFALRQEEKASDISDAYRRGIIGRGAMSSLSAMLMPEIYEDLGEKAKVGLGKLGSSGVGQSIPMDIFGERAAREYGFGGKDFAKLIRERSRNIDYQPGDFNPFDVDAWSSWDGYQKRGGQIPQMQGGGPTDGVTPQYQYGGRMQFGDRQQNQFMPQQNQFMQQTQEDLTPDLTPGPLSDSARSSLEGFQVFGSGNPLFGPDTDWSGLPIEGMPRDTTTTTTKTPGSAGTFSPYGDYGRQRGVAGALTAAGMGDKMLDPEFEKYMKYLPTFDMGYEQKIADYRTGAQGSLFGMTAPMGAGETTFSGSGAVKKARETGRKQTTDIYGRQERGVGEEYIKDVLAGLTAAETARESAFEAPSGDNPNPTSPPISAGEGQEPGLTAVSDGYNWEWNGYSWENRGPVSG